MGSAVKYNYLTTNPLEGLELLRINEASEPNPSSTLQFKSLLELIPEPYATLIYVDVCGPGSESPSSP